MGILYYRQVPVWRGGAMGGNGLVFELQSRKEEVIRLAESYY